MKGRREGKGREYGWEAYLFPDLTIRIPLTMHHMYILADRGCILADRGGRAEIEHSGPSL